MYAAYCITSLTSVKSHWNPVSIRTPQRSQASCCSYWSRCRPGACPSQCLARRPRPASRNKVAGAWPTFWREQSLTHITAHTIPNTGLRNRSTVPNTKHCSTRPFLLTVFQVDFHVLHIQHSNTGKSCLPYSPLTFALCSNYLKVTTSAHLVNTIPTTMNTITALTESGTKDHSLAPLLHDT